MPESSTARRLLDFSRLFASGDYGAALSVIESLAAENPNEGPIHWQLARTLERLERYADARAAVKRVLELRPEFAPAWVMRAELGEEAGDYDPEPDLRRAMRIDPRLGRAHYALGLLLHGEDEDEEARALMDKAVEFDPSLHEAFAARGGWSRVEAWTEQGIQGDLLERALADFDRAIAIRPLPSYRFARADLLQRLQRHEEARAELVGLLSELPEDHPVFGLAAQAQRRSEEAGATEAAPQADEAPQPPRLYVPVDASSFPKHQRAFESQATAALAMLGFTKLGDFEIAPPPAEPADRQMLSLYVREDGESVATAFSLKPAGQGLLDWLKGRKAKDVIEFETAFTDGAATSTNNAVDLVGLGPAALFEAHLGRVRSHTAARHEVSIRPVRTLEELLLLRSGVGERRLKEGADAAIIT